MTGAIDGLRPGSGPKAGGCPSTGRPRFDFQAAGQLLSLNGAASGRRVPEISRLVARARRSTAPAELSGPWNQVPVVGWHAGLVGHAVWASQCRSEGNPERLWSEDVQWPPLLQALHMYREEPGQGPGPGAGAGAPKEREAANRDRAGLTRGREPDASWTRRRGASGAASAAGGMKRSSACVYKATSAPAALSGTVTDCICDIRKTPRAPGTGSG